MKALYQTSVMVVGGREGFAKSDDGQLDLKLTAPKDMGGKGNATNPEQLYAAGYAACFESAIRHVARSQRLVIGNTAVEATVTLGTKEDGSFLLEVGLVIKIEDVSSLTAQKLMERAHEVCPYSQATRGNIIVNLKLADS